MDYEMNETNNQDWLEKGPWYKRYICSKLHGSRFEDFITQARTDRYNLMCSLVAHNRLQLDYKYHERNIGDREITNDAIIKTLEALGDTFNLLIYGLNCFMKIMSPDVRHILML